MKELLIQEIEATINRSYDLISRLDAIFFLIECGYSEIVAIKVTKLLQNNGYLGALA